MPDPIRSRGRPRTTPADPDQHTVVALDRALALLELVAAEPGRSLSDLAEKSGQALATVFRALVTLQARGMVEAIEPGPLWHIGPSAFRLGSAYLRRTGLEVQARSAMEGLVASSGETAALGIVSGARLLILAQCETRLPIRAIFPPGTLAPLHAAAPGKALLAWADDDLREEVLEGQRLERLTSLTITSSDTLARELSRTRERGFALDDQEQAEGMRGVAAPIFDSAGRVAAALSVCGPAFRFGLSDATRLGAAVRAAANRVTEAIGGQPPQDI